MLRRAVVVDARAAVLADALADVMEQCAGSGDFSLIRREALLSEELDTAKRYRRHAQEVRVVAADKSAPEIRQILLDIAVDYEHMARSMEAIDRTNKLLAKVERENAR